MNNTNRQDDIFDKSELFNLGGKTSNFIIVPAQIRYHHIQVEDFDKPIAAIAYNGSTFSLFRTSPEWTEVEKITNRLSVAYVITVIKKGWAIWVFEY